MKQKNLYFTVDTSCLELSQKESELDVFTQAPTSSVGTYS